MPQNTDASGVGENAHLAPFRESSEQGTPPSPIVSISIDASQADSTEKAEEPVRPLKSLLWASLYGLGGAVLWATVTAVTDYELGLVAVVLGLLVGNGAAKGGRGQIAQSIGASVAAASFLFAKFVTVVFIVLANADGSPPSEADANTVQEEWIEGPAAPSQPENGEVLAGSPTPKSDEPDAPLAVESADAEPQPPIGLAGLVVALFTAILQDTFTTMSGLFFGFAVWEGYRIPRRTQ